MSNGAPSGPFVLGIDVGTESCRVAVFTLEGSPVAFAAAGYASTHPHPGWAEQDPDDWYRALITATRTAMARSGLAGADIAGIGFAATSASVVALDEDAAVARWTPWTDVEADVRRLFTGPLADNAARETRVKYVDADGLRQRLHRFVTTWNTLRPRIVAQLVPARTLQTMLRDAGAPTTPADIGLTPHDVRSTFPRAMYYRSRYTVLDLAREAGWFDQLVDDVFAPGGLWT